MRRLPAAFELVNFGTKKGSRCWFPSSKTDWIIFNFASFSNKASPIFVRFSFIWGKKSFKVGTFPKNLPRLESFLPNVFEHQVGGEVFFSSNWPDRTYVSAYLPSLEAERLRNGLAVWGQETCFQNGKISGVQHMERNCVIEETFFFGGKIHLIPKRGPSRLELSPPVEVLHGLLACSPTCVGKTTFYRARAVGGQYIEGIWKVEGKSRCVECWNKTFQR